MKTPAERKRLERERKDKDQIAVRGTIQRTDKPIWDKINVDNKTKGENDE